MSKYRSEMPRKKLVDEERFGKTCGRHFTLRSSVSTPLPTPPLPPPLPPPPPPPPFLSPSTFPIRWKTPSTSKVLFEKSEYSSEDNKAFRGVVKGVLRTSRGKGRGGGGIAQPNSMVPGAVPVATCSWSSPSTSYCFFRVGDKAFQNVGSLANVNDQKTRVNFTAYYIFLQWTKPHKSCPFHYF